LCYAGDFQRPQLSVRRVAVRGYFAQEAEFRVTASRPSQSGLGSARLNLQAGYRDTPPQ